MSAFFSASAKALPAGSSGEIQFAKNGAFGASPNFTFDEEQALATAAVFKAGTFQDGNGAQILTTQQPAIADAVDTGTDPPTNEDFNALVATVNSTLAMLRTHGLIAS